MAQIGETSRGSHTAMAGFIALLLIVTCGSVLPAHVKQAIGLQGHWHRTLHVAAFLLVAALAREVFSRSAVTPVLLPLAMAASTELIQDLVFRSGFEWSDVRDDSIGIAAGVAMSLVIRRYVASPGPIPPAAE